MWNRNCPTCNKDIEYTRKWSCENATKKGLLCFQCVAIKRNSNEGYTNPFSIIKFDRNGSNNGMYNKEHSVNTIQKMSQTRKGYWTLDWCKNRYGSEEGQIIYDNKKLSHRVSRQKQIDGSNGKCVVSYNKNGCCIIDEYSKKLGLHFVHALNGGEKRISGYSVDGYCEEKMIVIEVDEPKHFLGGNLISKDITRMNELKKLGNRFIRVKYFRNGKWKEYINEVGNLF